MHVMREAKDLWPETRHSRWMSEGYEPVLASVIIPTYNRARFLGETMDSVWAQRHRPVELIVVDDGSGDSTPEILRDWGRKCAGDARFEFRSFRQQNYGAPTARNRGLIESRGQYIQFLDSDDLLHPRKLEIQVQAMEADTKCDFVCSQTALFTDVAHYEARPYCGWARERLLPDFINKLLWHTSSGLYRREACVTIGPWSEQLVRWQDWEYNVRFACLDPNVCYVPGTLSLFRQHSFGRIDDLGAKLPGVRGGLCAVKLVERSLGYAGLDQRVVGCEIVRRYYRIAREAMEVDCDELVREALAIAATKDICPLCRAKVDVAKLTYRLLGAGPSGRLLGVVGYYKRLLVDAAGALRGAPGLPAPDRNAPAHLTD